MQLKMVGVASIWLPCLQLIYMWIPIFHFKYTKMPKQRLALKFIAIYLFKIKISISHLKKILGSLGNQILVLEHHKSI